MPDFDWQRLKQLADEDTDFEAELLALFLQDAERSLKDLERAIASRRLQAIEDIAHSLRGASANVGASALALVASQLEQVARSGQLTNSPANPLVSPPADTLADIQGLLQQIRMHAQSIQIYLHSTPSKKQPQNRGKDY